MRLSLLFASGLCAAALATPSHAQLLGQQVNGTIKFGANPVNYYDPANGFVPGGFGNSGGQPVTIGGGIEFGFMDGANTDTADFSATQLFLSDRVFINAGSWTQTFTLVGTNQFNSLALVSDNFIPGLTFSLASGVIQINWDGTGAPNDFRAVFDVGSSLGGAVPEPGTWSLLILGFGVIGAGLRAGQRRRIGVSFA